MTSILMLDTFNKSLKVSSSFTLTYGRCYTLSPKKKSVVWGNKYGYYFYLFPQEAGLSHQLGFHVFIHEESEIFSEKNMYGDVFHEYMYVESGDSIQVNLKINKYNQMPSGSKGCSVSANYSKSKCMEDYVNKEISEHAGCSTPWIPNYQLSECNNYNQLYGVVSNSTSSLYLYNTIEKLNCPQKCQTTSYLPLMQSVKEIEASSWSLKIYYSTNLIQQMDEVVGYDWHNLISDLGGSLGFLLGLSVFGSISAIENLIDITIRKRHTSKKLQHTNEELEEQK
ncbi:hypothetical protein FQA39_LY03059 [Lamprigera yunnana]|nr:hypothetical protein FQA39_LY03059 [Lamprigera yunnana]